MFWPSDLVVDFNTLIFRFSTTGTEQPIYRAMHTVLLHFSLSIKAVTLIFISGRDLAISSTHEGKTGNINGKTENFNCLLRVNKYKLDSVKQKDP